MMNFNDGKIMRAENRVNVQLFVSATITRVNIEHFFTIFCKLLSQTRERDLINLPVPICLSHDEHDHDLIIFPSQFEIFFKELTEND